MSLHSPSSITAKPFVKKTTNQKHSDELSEEISAAEMTECELQAIDSSQNDIKPEPVINQISLKTPPVPPAPSGSQSTLGSLGSKSYSLAQMEEMAGQYNPTLAQASAVVGKACGIQTQVGKRPNPIVGYFGDEIGDGGTAGRQGAFISQTFVTGDKLRLNELVAEKDVQETSWKYEAQRMRVENDVRSRHYKTLGAQRRVELTTELLKIAEDGLKVTQQLFKAQQASRADILQAKIQLNQVQIIHQNALLAYQASWKRLVNVVGVPDLEPGRLTGDLKEQIAKVSDWDTSYQTLISNSPELQAAYYRVQRAQSQIERQQVQAKPNLQTQVGVGHDYQTGNEIVNAQLGVYLPLFNRNEGNITVASSDYHRALNDAERIQLMLRDQLAITYRNFQQASQQVERFEKEIIPSAKENLELTNEGYRQGEFEFLRVLTARRTFFESTQSYVTSLIALRQAEIQISGLLLTGGLNEVGDISPGAGGTSQRGQALNGQ
ncbi:MAG: TolC family protein [Planctomycetes bacterium]|nr:TolC family protein [Planctomycetota bacterium]MCH9727195.1 TolC family protein [Planctomycetota bacterium]MCH9778588.1 TolC family protein [Planctomycetota bacterium]MCH9791491.1 TolC family protein [Planctomycetota bacterium]MDF1742068.1 TolC family protein [Gimesia sp.]